MKMACIGFFGMRFGSLMIAILLCVASYQKNALAVEFELEKGQQFELCRDMAANLNSFPDLLPQPFDMPFDPELEDFRWVEWETLNPLDHFDVVRQASIYRNGVVGQKNPEELEAEWQRENLDLLEKARAGNLFLERSSFDANQDGVIEQVYRISRDTFRWPASYSRKGWVLAWNLLVMPEDNPMASRHMSSYARRPLQPFYYKERIYYWNASWPLVYEAIEGRNGEDFVLISVCEYSVVSE